MRILFSLLILGVSVLIGCNLPSQSHLDGAWQSDRDRTLAELEKLEGLDEQLRASLSVPEAFGKSIHIYEQGLFVVAVNVGMCADVGSSFVAVEQGRDFMRAEFAQSFEGAEQEIYESRFVNDEMHSSIPGFKQATGIDGFEVFRRLSLDEVKKAHPCVEKYLK